MSLSEVYPKSEQNMMIWRADGAAVAQKQYMGETANVGCTLHDF